MFNQNLNDTIQNILKAKNSGKNPNAILQLLYQRNPNFQQLATQLQNMAQGRSPQEFITQLARQNGVSQDNLQAISELFK